MRSSNTSAHAAVPASRHLLSRPFSDPSRFEQYATVRRSTATTDMTATYSTHSTDYTKESSFTAWKHASKRGATRLSASGRRGKQMRAKRRGEPCLSQTRLFCFCWEWVIPRMDEKKTDDRYYFSS